MQYFNNVLETIGNTPLIKLNSVVRNLPCLVLAKVETTNPGNSVKDRMALKMIEVAEKEGKLKPGGTIIEGTSGNTGMGLALAAIIKGYKCIFVTTDKQSKEKADILRAVGAEVIVCPTNVLPEDPMSYYSVAARLAKEVPNSFHCNQYDNLANRLAHYEGTGPEIWEQTEGKITHLVCTAGTGGTITGTAMYLKEKNPNIKIWAVDAYGSLLTKYFRTGELDMKEVYPYVSEGFGEDFVPKNYDMSVIDHFEQVTDKEGAIMARRITKEEGIFVGYSAGSCVQGLVQLKEALKPDDVVVCIFHDHGSRYVAKLYNNDWMRERGFLETELKVGDLIANRKKNKFIAVGAQESVKRVLHLMKEMDISQLPVMDGEHIVGSVTESNILEFILTNPLHNSERPVSEIMAEPFPMVNIDLPIRELNKYISKKMPAVIAENISGERTVVTQYDIIQAL
jgi:cystathionine beta-synthase